MRNKILKRQQVELEIERLECLLELRENLKRNTVTVQELV
jgi:hypothetical protein